MLRKTETHTISVDAFGLPCAIRVDQSLPVFTLGGTIQNHSLTAMGDSKQDVYVALCDLKHVVNKCISELEEDDDVVAIRSS